MKNKTLSFCVYLGIDNGYGTCGHSIVEIETTGKVIAVTTYFTSNNGEELGYDERLYSELSYKQKLDLNDAIEIFLQGVAHGS